MRKLLAIFLFPVFYACSVNNTREDNSLVKYFDQHQLKGTFALFDNGTGEFTVYNMNRYRDSAYLPASTFKIVNSLIGIETGVVKDSATVIPWDGVTRAIPEWNRDLKMHEAFTYSCVPWFRELARRIGKDTMQHWLDTLGYAQLHGKVVIKNNLDTFWLDNSLKITPDEQLGLVKRLYFDQLPFFKTYQEVVKRAMLFENNANYRLGYKTGWGVGDDKARKQIGWMIGWIEENRHPYFFVLNIESQDPNIDMPAIRIKMLKEILKDQGFFEGRM